MNYRVYYNATGDKEPWSVDQGTPETETNHAAIVITEGASAMTYISAATEQPHAWMLVVGKMTVVGAMAVFTAEDKQPA